MIYEFHRQTKLVANRTDRSSKRNIARRTLFSRFCCPNEIVWRSTTSKEAEQRLTTMIIYLWTKNERTLNVSHLESRQNIVERRKISVLSREQRETTSKTSKSRLFSVWKLFDCQLIDRSRQVIVTSSLRLRSQETSRETKTSDLFIDQTQRNQCQSIVGLFSHRPTLTRWWVYLDRGSSSRQLSEIEKCSSNMNNEHEWTISRRSLFDEHLLGRAATTTSENETILDQRWQNKQFDPTRPSFDCRSS